MCKSKPQSQFMVGFGHIFEIQKEVKSMQKQLSCIKRVRPSKTLGKKSCEIKGDSHEMAAMMLILYRFHNFFHPGFLKAAPFLYSLAVFAWISLLFVFQIYTQSQP